MNSCKFTLINQSDGVQMTEAYSGLEQTGALYRIIKLSTVKEETVI